ncbi:UbiA prenyltransferase [Methanosalsum zhilinae DSM 4017]|uniref:Digeranylgeranylglyceryl phosphate synthase n=1 Tax=Methanosalsum zhilinae (strain DSM 4017 / NBRC 107636 / OCM 62 / WeN5) TaxID=679901 RepID=F7XPD5_METZD|nr:geranylgeranylglycerol-phosphate geranylgeranyltransferase [Methanosalsum zhilinae]AEH60262.1 UbiA prenyltransferase [Methanosalsum zhilinae DSM 4017]
MKKTINVLLPYLQLIRYRNCLMAAIGTLIGVFIAYNILPTTSITYSAEILIIKALLAFVSVFFITGAGNSINDYFDVDIDAINRPSRPIPAGKVTEQNALYFSTALFIAGMVAAFSVNYICAVIAGINVLVLIYYARSLKRKALVGNISIGYLTGSIFLFGGSVFGMEGLMMLSILFLLAALATMAREIVKDIEDIEGDRLSGASTLPIKIGVKRSVYTASFIVAVALVASPLPYIISILGTGYLYAVAIADLLFILAIIEVGLRDNAARSSRLFKAGMVFALIAFIAGA